jgi:hypothetical protein
MIKIGFTGTREGMSSKQKEEIKQILQSYLDKGKKIVVNHGDCLGADKDFHDICRSLSSDIVIRIYPPSDNKLRAYCKGDNILETKPYLERNKDIINSCDILLACPKTKEEELRSGTWYTIRYARENDKKFKIIV